MCIKKSFFFPRINAKVECISLFKIPKESQPVVFYILRDEGCVGGRVTATSLNFHKEEMTEYLTKD